MAEMLVNVRYRGDGYHCRIRGHTGSSTADPETAIERARMKGANVTCRKTNDHFQN